MNTTNIDTIFITQATHKKFDWEEFNRAGLAQWLELLPCKQRVESSILSIGCYFFFKFIKNINRYQITN